MTDHIIFKGSIVGREVLAGLEFNPDYFYSGCLICGDVYQTEADRNPPDAPSPEYEEYFINQKKRHFDWRYRENKRHSEREHRMLLLSGNWCTPEAARKLAPLGLFSLTDLVKGNEITAALGEAPRAPEGDAQSPRGLGV
jgi:hypothetical protein